MPENGSSKYTRLSQDTTIYTSHPPQPRTDLTKIERPDTMDPITILTTSIALASAALGTTDHAKKFYRDYKNADRGRLQVQRQKEQLQINRNLLQHLPHYLRIQLPHVDGALNDIEAALPSQPPARRKRDNLGWAAGVKKKAKTETNLLNNVESSTKLTLLLNISKTVDEIAEQVSNQDQKFTSYDIRLQSLESHTGYQFLYGPPEISKGYYNRRLTAKTHQWNTILYIGMTLRLIVSQDNHHRAYSFLFQWPIFYGLVLLFRISIYQYWLKMPYFSIRPRQIIDNDAAIIKACKANNIALIQQLFTTSQSYITDITSDGFTLLRFAIRAGHYDVVKLLLDNGADPNQPFGVKDTSPLNNAFLAGRVDIIRLLLSAHADLDYVNKRAWTSIYYIWDPGLPNHVDTAQILDICATHQFDGWQFSDIAGWAPIHRAAAFGEADHIQKLFNLGVVDHYSTSVTVANWCPIQCAVRYGNLSTFRFLIQGIHNQALVRLRDSRGWSLLHLAAASGSEDMISLLLSLGLGPTALSDPATLLLPEELEYKSLTPRTIAEYYQHGAIYERALLEARVSDGR